MKEVARFVDAKIAPLFSRIEQQSNHLAQLEIKLDQVVTELASIHHLQTGEALITADMSQPCPVDAAGDPTRVSGLTGEHGFSSNTDISRAPGGGAHGK